MLPFARPTDLAAESRRASSIFRCRSRSQVTWLTIGVTVAPHRFRRPVYGGGASRGGGARRPGTRPRDAGTPQTSAGGAAAASPSVIAWISSVRNPLATPQ